MNGRYRSGETQHAVVRDAGADVNGQIFNTLSHDRMTYAFGEKRNKTTSFPLRHTLLIYTFPSRSSDQTRKRKGRSLFIPPKYKKIPLPSYPLELRGYRTDGETGRADVAFVSLARQEGRRPPGNKWSE